ncbi:hypothetical protein GGD41_005000 [Paraburkholderia bryophila]|uniref:Uncharacterized protein n=1 Tax=Paraburkholderia bryophila TaxID=420952 RepID=A0A7Y9WBG1_9BURK|nr:hypothetical protein [Paraburkholderia bryophila]
MRFCFLSPRRSVGFRSSGRGGCFCRCSDCVGLSLFSRWSIGVPPVRGGTYFSLPAAKKSRQKKAAHTANSEAGPSRSHGSGSSGIRAPAHSASVTKPSSAPAPLRAPNARSTNPGEALHFAETSPFVPRLRRGEADDPHNPPTNPGRFLVNRSDEHAVQDGMDDGFVTGAECAGTQIPDAPLPVVDHGAPHKS